MIDLHESMGPGRDRTRDPWICSQTRICCQTRYRLRYEARTRQMDIIMFVKSWCHKLVHKEGGGSVVECSTQGVVGLGLTGGTALCP